MSTHDPTLTKRRLLLCEAIANGLTRKQAAVFSGLSARGVDRAMTDPRVKAEVDRRSAEISQEVRGRLRSIRMVAIKALGEVAGDTQAQGGARVAAANSILDRIGVGKTQILEVISDAHDADPEARIARLAARLGSALSTIPDAGDDDPGIPEDDDIADEDEDE
jgi:hypothetical protein